MHRSHKANLSTYHCTPSGKGLRLSFRSFCTIFLQPQGGVAKLNEFATLSFFQKKEVRTLQIRTSGVKYKYEN